MRTALALLATFGLVYVAAQLLVGGFLGALRLDPVWVGVGAWAASCAAYFILRRIFGQRLPRI